MNMHVTPQWGSGAMPASGGVEAPTILGNSAEGFVL